jgi:hypothetical protein
LSQAQATAKYGYPDHRYRQPNKQPAICLRYCGVYDFWYKKGRGDLKHRLAHDDGGNDYQRLAIRLIESRNSGKRLPRHRALRQVLLEPTHMPAAVTSHLAAPRRLLPGGVHFLRTFNMPHITNSGQH